MSTNVIMPQMGESVAEGTVVKWFKRPGDHVERDEPLLEISTDKVDAEIPSPAAGVLARILVHENETVEVNAVLAVIDGEGAAAPPAGSAAEVPAAVPSASSSSESSEPLPASGGEPTSVNSEQPLTETRHSEAAEHAQSQNEIRSSPLVRRMAREHNVDLALVQGTGLGGRISKKEIGRAHV